MGGYVTPEIGVPGLCDQQVAQPVVQQVTPPDRDHLLERGIVGPDQVDRVEPAEEIHMRRVTRDPGVFGSSARAVVGGVRQSRHVLDPRPLCPEFKLDAPHFGAWNLRGRRDRAGAARGQKQKSNARRPSDARKARFGFHMLPPVAVWFGYMKIAKGIPCSRFRPQTGAYPTP